LAVRDKKFLSQVETQEDRDKKGRESISGEPEAIKILPELGESVPQSGAKFKDLSFIGEGETVGEKEMELSTLKSSSRVCSKERW